MINEKDSIKTILEGRGVISNGVFDEVRFKKLVTEPWLYSKTLKYGFDKMNEHNTKDVDSEPVIEEVVETSTESVLLDEDLKEEVEEPVVAEEVPTEEPVVDECPLYEAAPVVVEEPTVEVVEEVAETPKKKTSKKK